MEGSANVNTFFSIQKNLINLKKPGVYSPGSISIFFFFFPRSFLKDEKFLCVKWGLFYIQQPQAEATNINAAFLLPGAS